MYDRHCDWIYRILLRECLCDNAAGGLDRVILQSTGEIKT